MHGQSISSEDHTASNWNQQLFPLSHSGWSMKLTISIYYKAQEHNECYELHTS